MRAIRWVAVALASLLLTPVTAGPIEILLTGTWHGDEVRVEPGADWWGIFPEGEGFTLQLAPVTMTLEEDGIVDEPGQMTGKKVTVPQEAVPVLLVRGLPSPRQGAVAITDPQAFGKFLYPGEVRYLALPEANAGPPLRLAALGVAREREDLPVVEIYSYSLRLYADPGANTASQEIARIPELDGDGLPRLIWAGDLDRDGKVDLLFDLTDHYNVSRLTLFLSSAASEGELVGKVAEWVTTGC